MAELSANRRSVFFEIAAAIRQDRAIYLALLIYLLGGAVYVHAKSYVMFDGLETYLPYATILYGVVMPLVLLLLGTVHIIHRLDHRRKLAFRLMFQQRRIGRLVAGTVLTLVVLVLFGSMFASVKSAFSVDGFAFDKSVADLNKLIHFGHPPAAWLHAVAGSPAILRVVDYNYETSWFLLCFGFFYWMAISQAADRVRTRYCITFMVVWTVVGNVIAGIFTTAGPAYYGRVTGDLSRFAPLQAFLAAGNGDPGSAVNIQNYLWSLHVSHGSGFGAGISAFPSMHVAMATMTALFIGERSRRGGIAAWLFTAVIMASSVYLGWHYAIDGYAAVVLTVAIYWGIRWLTAPRTIRGGRLAAASMPAGSDVSEGPAGAEPTYSEAAG